MSFWKEDSPSKVGWIVEKFEMKRGELKIGEW
jgi:hypothetical protein